MSGGLNVGTFGSSLDQLKTVPPTPEQRRAAQLAVCDAATDTDEARELLAMLGLLED